MSILHTNTHKNVFYNYLYINVHIPFCTHIILCTITNFLNNYLFISCHKTCNISYFFAKKKRILNYCINVSRE